MNRFEGTSARQLDLMDDRNTPMLRRQERGSRRTGLRLLRKDIYAELERRRRRAQITARHLLDD